MGHVTNLTLVVGTGEENHLERRTGQKNVWNHWAWWTRGTCPGRRSFSLGCFCTRQETKGTPVTLMAWASQPVLHGMTSDGWASFMGVRSREPSGIWTASEWSDAHPGICSPVVACFKLLASDGDFDFQFFYAVFHDFRLFDSLFLCCTLQIFVIPFTQFATTSFSASQSMSSEILSLVMICFPMLTVSVMFKGAVGNY